MSAYVHHAAEPHERVEIEWSGHRGEIPVLHIAGTSIHLKALGADLGPWLLALSDKLAEFASTVEPDGTPVPTLAEMGQA